MGRSRRQVPLASVAAGEGAASWLRHVRQTNRSSGCGPACVAIIAGVSERDAVRAIFGEDRTSHLYTSWKQLRRGLKRFGFALSKPIKVASLSEIGEVAIVGLAKAGAPGGPILHWVVYSASPPMVFDPARDAPVTPTRCRRPPVAYATIHPSNGAASAQGGRS